MTKVGVVGSRRRLDSSSVYALVASLPDDTIIVSGGCRGVDSWAENAARRRGLPEPLIHHPNYVGVTNKWQAIRALFARNTLVARDSEVLYAFVALDREGGTEDTIRKFESIHKKRAIIK